MTVLQVDAPTHMRREIEEIPAAAQRLLEFGAQPVREAARQAGTPQFLASVARGSSDHAATFVKYASELYLGLAVASLGPSVTSVYHRRIRLKNALVFAISQSGASPDIISMVRDAADQGGTTVGFTNTPGSDLTWVCSSTIDICAGPELSVAATKTFVSSTLAGLVLVAELGNDRDLLAALHAVPAQLEQAISVDWSPVASAIAERGSLYVIGRGPGLAIAHEAALKFKETCQIHAEAYSSAEVLHGPVSIVDSNYPVLALGVRDAAEKSVADIADHIAEQGANVFATTEAVTKANKLPFAATGHPLTDALVQIASFYSFIEGFARARGLDPDSPRHLKKVTQTV